MNITIAAATRIEIKEEFFQPAVHIIQFLYTGVGLLASAVSLTRHVLQQKPGLIIQAGVAGCLDTQFALGDVVAVRQECLGDTGVQEKEGWKDIFDMGFQEADATLFTNKYIVNNRLHQYNLLQLPEVTGITINEITTNPERLLMLISKYGAQTESMEGASLHYVCRLLDIPFIQVRAISNYVGERDKSKWKIKEGVANLNEAVAKMVNNLSAVHNS